MRIPPPLPPIDVDDAWEQIQGGMTIAEYARLHGRVAASVSRALRRAGIRVPKRRPEARDELDRSLRSAWRSIRDRCEDPASVLYPRYGAQGIRICREWLSFVAFRDWARAQGFKPGLAIALRSRGRGYRPSNCYLGARGDAVREGVLASVGGITAFGETKSIAAWGRDPRAKVCGEGIRTRILAGLPPDVAITCAPHSVVLDLPSLARKGPKIRRNPIDWVRVQELYVDEGLGVPEVARRLHASYHGILRGLQKRGWVRERRTVRELKNGRLLHRAWLSMRERCYSAKHSEYPNVGARGVRVDEEWEDFRAFHAWALAAGYRKGLCLTRLDRADHYGPKNCAWLSRTDAARFHPPAKVSRKPRFTISAFGERKGPVAWARDPRCTVTTSGLIARLKTGMPPEQAITAVNERADIELEGSGVRAFGSTRSVQAWARDPRARVGGSSIKERILRGWTPEQAITTPPFGRRK